MATVAEQFNFISWFVQKFINMVFRLEKFDLCGGLELKRELFRFRVYFLCQFTCIWVGYFLLSSAFLIRNFGSLFLDKRGLSCFPCVGNTSFGNSKKFH